MGDPIQPLQDDAIAVSSGFPLAASGEERSAGSVLEDFADAFT